MKKMTILMAVLATLGSNAAFAQTGKAATTSANTASSNGMAWGVGLGSLAVLATVVGLTASSAASSPSTYSH